jgi:hypothetical protein
MPRGEKWQPAVNLVGWQARWGYRVLQGAKVVVMVLALTPLCHIAAAASLVPLIWGAGPRPVDRVDPHASGAEEGCSMARAIDRRQVERWLAEGLSLRQCAQRLGLPSTTFWRQWQRLQQEAATPIQAEVTELPPRPGPPAGPPTRPPEGPPAQVHTGIPAELQAIQQDLLDMVAWWRERQRPRVHPEVHPRATERWTVHVDTRWIQAVKQEAAREGEPIMAVVNRIFRRYFEGR